MDGHLLEVATSMCVAQPDLAGVSCTGREKQTNNYRRSGNTETVTVQMRAPREFRDALGRGWTMNATEVVEDTGPGTARVSLEFTSPGEADIAGAFLGIELPASVFSGGRCNSRARASAPGKRLSLAAGRGAKRVRARHGEGRAVSLPRPADRGMFDPADSGGGARRPPQRQLRYAGADGRDSGQNEAGQSARNGFALKVAGEVDRNPVEVALDASHPGQLFDGLGGNFRIQNARADRP